MTNGETTHQDQGRESPQADREEHHCDSQRKSYRRSLRNRRRRTDDDDDYDGEDDDDDYDGDAYSGSRRSRTRSPDRNPTEQQDQFSIQSDVLANK
jgi:hypothetical protein